MSYVDQELTVEDMLADPIVQTLMRYDGISASDVRHTIEAVNQHRPENPDDEDAAFNWKSGSTTDRLRDTAA